MKSLIIIFILISIGGYSQNEFNKAYRLDADTKQETFFSGLVTTDSALYLTGIAKIDTPTNTYYQTGFFARLDTNGNLIFAKTYGNPQQTREFIYNNLKMSENGILYTNYENQEYSIGFAEVNTLGEAILLKDYYPQAPNAILSISKGITKLQNGGFLLLGSLLQTGQECSTLAIFTDSLGNEVSRKVYKNPNYDSTQPYKVYVFNDSTIVISSLLSIGTFQTPTYKRATWLIEINYDGEIIWEYTSPFSRNIAAPYIIQSSDNQYICVGSEILTTYNNGNYDYPQQAYIMKIAKDKSITWGNRIGQDKSYFGNAVEKNGAYYIMGSHISPNDSKGWLLKMSENGDSLWSQYYKHPLFTSPYCSFFPQKLVSYKEGFMFCGMISNDVPASDPQHGYWGWLVRTDSMGNVSPLLNTANAEPIHYEHPDMWLYPNPSVGVLNIELAESLTEDASIFVYTSEGKEVSHICLPKGEKRKQLATWQLPQGFYNCVLQLNGNQLYSKSFLKLN